MDPDRFDRLARALAMAAGRRALLGAALAAVGLAGANDLPAAFAKPHRRRLRDQPGRRDGDAGVAAEKRKKKKKKKLACAPNCAGRACGPDGCGGACAPGCNGAQRCDAAGRCVACLTAGDCPAPGPCERRVCISGTCTLGAEPDGTECNAGSIGGVCCGGTCRPGRECCGDEQCTAGSANRCIEGRCAECKTPNDCGGAGPCGVLACEAGRCVERPRADESACPGPPGARCCGGICRPAVEACGSCATPCNARSDTCVAGECRCGGGPVCPTDATCQSGTCVCGQGSVFCGDTCATCCNIGGSCAQNSDCCLASLGFAACGGGVCCVPSGKTCTSNEACCSGSCAGFPLSTCT
jgi:hypothetical protein